jgi:DNA-binding NarL/FixJ family response regulator
MKSAERAPTTRILVVDDHSVTRRGVKALIETRARWSVCGEAGTGSEAIRKAKQLKPNVVIMDLSLPELNGLEATRQIRQEVPQVRVLMLTMHDAEEAMRDALSAGASGYVLKSDLDVSLFTAIEALSQGNTFFSAKVSEVIMDGFVKGSQSRETPSNPPTTRLTPRQREIMRHLADGKLNKQVAGDLNISVKTVEAHRAQIMAKLNLRSFSDMVRYAVRNGIVKA